MTELGTVLDGKYEILKKVGQGGMSIVYLAMDNRLNKQWAVKEIKNDGSKSTATLLKSLEREANILKDVDHPVLPRIVDIINENGTIYVVMDFVEGKPLSDVLKAEGAQDQNKVIEWGRALASALDYLHSMNPPIIYRDMKPSNVMLKPDGSVKLIDFGTAKEYIVENNADTTALGTRGYAAPEQFGDSQGRGIYNTDARTDIYNLGATLYHLVTGKNPCEPPYEIKPIRQCLARRIDISRVQSFCMRWIITMSLTTNSRQRQREKLQYLQRWRDFLYCPDVVRYLAESRRDS